LLQDIHDDTAQSPPVAKQCADLGASVSARLEETQAAEPALSVQPPVQLVRSVGVLFFYVKLCIERAT